MSVYNLFKLFIVDLFDPFPYRSRCYIFTGFFGPIGRGVSVLGKRSVLHSFMSETRAPGSLGRIAEAHLLPGLGQVERVVKPRRLPSLGRSKVSAGQARVGARNKAELSRNDPSTNYSFFLCSN